MIIVVSDTSPIRALGNLGLLNVLEQLYDEVIIPQAVALELSQAPIGQSVIALDNLAKYSFLRIETVSQSAELTQFLRELDRGESEALTLALKLRADLILIDELAGRSAAKRSGLEVIGVLGVLLKAKHQGLIESVAPPLNDLQTNYQFFIGEDLRLQILRAAGE